MSINYRDHIQDWSSGFPCPPTSGRRKNFVCPSFPSGQNRYTVQSPILFSTQTDLWRNQRSILHQGLLLSTINSSTVGLFNESSIFPRQCGGEFIEKKIKSVRIVTHSFASRGEETGTQNLKWIGPISNELWFLQLCQFCQFTWNLTVPYRQLPVGLTEQLRSPYV